MELSVACMQPLCSPTREGPASIRLTSNQPPHPRACRDGAGVRQQEQAAGHRGGDGAHRREPRWLPSLMMQPGLQ